MSKIYLNGKLVGNTDNRFNEKQTQVGIDPRINRRKRKGITIKGKYIFYIILAIAIYLSCVRIEVGIITPQTATQGLVSEVKAKDVETPVKELSIKEKILQKFGKDGEKMLAVANCESRLNPNAVGDDYVIRGLHAPSIGLFQIRTLKGRPSAEELKNVDTNIDFAYQLYSKQGLTPWKTCGSYWQQWTLK